MKNEIYNSLQAEARNEGRSVSDVVRVLVNGWLEDKRYEKKLLKHTNSKNHPRGTNESGT
jgi:predicted CopG family antitoxin